MERSITLQQIERERAERLAKAGSELLAVVEKTVTREILHQLLVDSAYPMNRIKIMLAYEPPRTLTMGDICETCHQSLGFYLATLASPIDFAYNVYRDYRKKEPATFLLIAPRRRPWYRELIDFPATNVMTTDVVCGPHHLRY